MPASAELALLRDQLPVTLASGVTVEYADLDYAATAPCLAAAAEVVGVSRATLYRRLGQLEIESG